MINASTISSAKYGGIGSPASYECLADSLNVNFGPDAITQEQLGVMPDRQFFRTLDVKQLTGDFAEDIANQVEAETGILDTDEYQFGNYMSVEQAALVGLRVGFLFVQSQTESEK